MTLVTEIPYTFATWVYVVHRAGVPVTDPGLSSAVATLDAADGEAGCLAAGEALVASVAGWLPDAEPKTVFSAAKLAFGFDIGTDFGDGARGERNQRIRRYQFNRDLPWLARIWERHNDEVQPCWLLVERVTDQVSVMDANPWNDIPEERSLAVGDFHVLWELDACTAVYVR